MSSVSSVPSALSYLTQQGGPLSNLPAAVSASSLQSASPQDIVSLSIAAIQAQVADGLFGGSAATTTNSILPGVSTADLSGATPQEQSAIDNQTLLLQQSQALFNTSLPTSPNISLYG
jgi:hypothetical protein